MSEVNSWMRLLGEVLAGRKGNELRGVLVYKNPQDSCLFCRRFRILLKMLCPWPFLFCQSWSKFTTRYPKELVMAHPWVNHTFH